MEAWSLDDFSPVALFPPFVSTFTCLVRNNFFCVCYLLFSATFEIFIYYPLFLTRTRQWKMSSTFILTFSLSLNFNLMCRLKKPVIIMGERNWEQSEVKRLEGEFLGIEFQSQCDRCQLPTTNIFPTEKGIHHFQL